MLVREVMSRPAVTVGEDETLKDATALMEQEDVSAMPVLDATGRLVGVVTEADVIRHLVVPDPRAHELPVRLTTVPFARTVGEVMSPAPTTVTPDTDLATATEILSTGAYKSLPVVEDSQVIGVLSRRDVVRVLARADSRIESDVRKLFDDVRRDWAVEVADGVVKVAGATSEPDRRLAQALVVTVPGVVALRLDDDPA